MTATQCRICRQDIALGDEGRPLWVHPACATDLDEALQDMLTPALPADFAAGGTGAPPPERHFADELFAELPEERSRMQAGAGLSFIAALVVVFVAGLLLGMATGERDALARFLAAPVDWCQQVRK